MYRYPLSQPYLHSDAQLILSQVLSSGWVSCVGETVSIFEEDLCNYLSVRYSFATQSGTSALHLSLLGLGIGAGDIVLVPSITFIAPVNAVYYVGATPVFIDCDSDLNISPRYLKEFAERCADIKRGRLYFNRRPVRGIVVVHVLGNPCDIDFIMNFASDYKLAVIEDTTEALGAEFAGKKLGVFGDCGVLSFNGNKLITTGSGGAVVTNSKKLYRRVKYLGMQAKDDGLYYIHNEVGYNYRMSALQAGLGISQLRHIELHLKRKRQIYIWYKEQIKRQGLKQVIDLVSAKRGISSHWLTAIKLKTREPATIRDRLIGKMALLGIQVRPLWYPNHLQRPYRNCCYIGRGEAVRLWERLLCVPSDISLKEADICYIVEQIKRCIDER